LTDLLYLYVKELRDGKHKEKNFYKFGWVTCKLRQTPLCVWSLYKLRAAPLYLHKKSLWADRSILILIKSLQVVVALLCILCI